MENNYAIIMAGGIGSRFWPMSTPEHPKQFLDVLGIGRTLIQMTYDRILHSAPKENVYILTNESYKELVKQQLPEIEDYQILCEPQRKNTAPCLAYGAAKIYKKNPNATMIVCSSDHLIMQQDKFTSIIATAVNQANNGDRIVAVGIQPTRPDTGYGYIEYDTSAGLQAGDVTEIKQFREKPDLATAQSFLDSGNFCWNSGIFIWKASTLLNALKSFKPALYELFAADLSFYYAENEQVKINHCFEACEDVSIDYAVMENATNRDVVLADFDWSDLGTWGSLFGHLNKDENNNSIIGQHTHVFNSSNTQVNVPHNKLVVIDGLNDYIVVESDDMLLILKNENEQELKQFLAEAKAKSPEFF